VDPGPLHDEQRVVEAGVGGEDHHGADASQRQGPVPSRLRQGEQVLGVHEAEHVVDVVAHDHQPGVTGPDDLGLGGGRRGGAGHPGHGAAGDHHRGGRALSQVEGAREELVGDLLDEALVPGGAEHGRELVGGGTVLSAFRGSAPRARTPRLASALSVRITGRNSVT
jgi:hypothetical protein